MDKNFANLCGRLSYLINNKNITPYTIWKETGISQATLSNILNGKTKNISRKNLEILSKYFKVEKEWLRSGNGSIYNSGNQINANEINGNITQTLDNRQYYSDSPDVLRAEIDKLDRIIAEKEERIKEKDAQIKEKDAQIKEKDAQIKEKDAQIKALLEILKK